MNKFGFAFAFAAMMAPSAAFAAAEWSAPVQVAAVQVYSDPNTNSGANEVVVRFDKDPFSDGCPFASTLTWYVEGNAENVGRMIALLTAAKLSKSNVKVYRSDANDCRTDSIGSPGYPKLRGIELTNQ